ncbi:MAG TPA: cobyric acid synthase [Campylobacterales bacterium]|nr:cobyric acid synthase [Campylobacterales bacterium]
MRPLSVFGTSSDAGKSTIALALCKILADSGYSVAPFKAQNMSNNACVCDDGGEIGVAQYTQAVMLGLSTSYHFNPILLKPQKDSESQVVIKGKAAVTQDAREYFKNIESLKPVVNEAFDYLRERYDIVVCEGAGSPVELNLMEKDLSNVYTAREFGAKIILVADIERGGIFASVYGTYALLPEDLRESVIGVIVNKFRGDMSLFDEGRRIIEERFGIPVLGVVPHIDFSVGYEDALSLSSYAKQGGGVKIAIIKYPHIANFTDFEPLIIDSGLSVEFVDKAQDLNGFDAVILPGTKATISDLRWLKASGLYKRITEYQGYKVGICGGYQMMFERVCDPHGVESEEGSVEAGLGYIDDEIVFGCAKTLGRGVYEYDGKELPGYEIHCGQSAKYPLFFESEKLFGTHLHGIFDNDAWRTAFIRRFDPSYEGYEYARQRQKQIDALAHGVKQSVDIPKIIEALSC